MSITTTPAPSSPDTSPASAGLPDPRPAFARAVALGRDVIGAARPDQFELPTPCPAYNALAMIGHLTAVIQRVGVIGAGGDLAASPTLITDVADDDWVALYDRFAERTAAIWADDTVLTNTVTVPWAQLPGAVALMIYVSEVTVHTWDLAVATGQQPAWEPEVVGVGLAAMQRGLPAKGRMASFGLVEGEVPAFDPPFGEAQPVTADAPLIDQLVAWCGRNPARPVTEGIDVR